MNSHVVFSKRKEKKMVLYVRAGDVIFEQGDTQPSMFNIQEGKVAIVIDRGQASEKQLVELGEGQFFGEMSLLESQPRSASAVAVTDGVLEVIDEESFNGFVQANPEFAMKMLKYFSVRLRAVTADYQEACRTIAETYALPAVKEAVEKADEAKVEVAEEAEAVEDEEQPVKKKGFLARQLEKFAEVYNSDAYREIMSMQMYHHF